MSRKNGWPGRKTNCARRWTVSTPRSPSTPSGRWRRPTKSAEFSAMQEDRSRLALELDAATARLRAFEAANGEALARVERASAAVRALLAAGKSADCGAAFSEEN